MSTSSPVIHFAQYVLRLAGEVGGDVTALKLQKLLYYVQAWGLVDARFAPFVDEAFVKWKHGPVVPAVYHHIKHNGAGVLQPMTPDPRFVPSGDRAALAEAIVSAYTPLSAGELSARTHREAPWRDAADGVEISRASMRQFYDEQQPFRSNFPFDPARPFVAVGSNAHAAATLDLPRPMADRLRTFASYEAYRAHLRGLRERMRGYDEALGALLSSTTA